MTGTSARLLRSTPFRLALTFGFLFMLAFVLSGAIVYQMMSADLAEQLDDTIKETYAVIAATYADSDPKELVETVDSHSMRSPKKEQLFSLTDTAGNRLAGNFTAAGLPDGFSNFGAEMPGLPKGTEYRAYSGALGPDTLTVAISLSETEELETIMLMSFGWATLIITGLAVTGGALLASRVQRRLDGIAATMVDVSHGRLDARIPLTGKGDDIDIVSSQVNAALDRLSGLVDGMKQVSANIAHDLKTPLNRLQMILRWGRPTRPRRIATFPATWPMRALKAIRSMRPLTRCCASRRSRPARARHGSPMSTWARSCKPSPRSTPTSQRMTANRCRRSSCIRAPTASTAIRNC